MQDRDRSDGRRGGGWQQQRAGRRPRENSERGEQRDGSESESGGWGWGWGVHLAIIGSGASRA